MAKVNEDIYGSSLRRNGKIQTSDIDDGAVTKDKLASEVHDSMLPEATTSDSGKVPVVNEEGEWELGEGGGGSESVMVVTISYSSNTYEADVSYADIVAAIENGTSVLFYLTGADGVGFAYYDEEYSEISSSILYATSSTINYSYIVYTSEGIEVDAKSADITWS